MDRVADCLAELGHANIEVRGLADSGWFLDNTPYSSGSSTSSSAFASSWLVTSPAQAVKKGVELWKGKVPERCHRDYPNEAWRCYFGYRVYPTLKAPLFVFQWLFDEAQMTADNVGAPVTKEQWDYIHQTGDNLRKTFENVTGLFAASCISHTVLTKRDWQAIRLGDATLPQALHCWEMHHLRKRKGKGPHQIDQDGDPNHHHKHHAHHGHHSHGHVAYVGSSRREGILRNADDTANADLNQATEQLRGENVTVEVLRGGSGRESELMEREGMESKVGRDGKHRRKGKRKRRKRRRRKKKRGREEEELEEEKGETERGERKHRRGNRGGRRGDGHRGRRKNAGHGGGRVRRSELSNEKLDRMRGEEVSDINLRGKRRGGGHCSYRLMERCTWPQCNHSCPKLHNPFTGEEMDFIELLKSFGLDMTSVANALGIDIHTLNNMDHDELLNLLTQQSN
ncbi:hypothetical protein J437_LFUL002086 [Ladona fulva]|uniref:Uncharacterized protein n=1 Tax=Ladona fulva TaxID=123851 RepID=A0A8K0K0S0_LADFU|nr:hypothetical protein J437_LFUL002086 [Ladona fulva]